MAWDIDALFTRHSQGIFLSLKKRGFDTETALDLTQDAFLRALQAQPRGDAPEHSMRAYLYKIARNLGINYARRQGLAPMLPLDAASQASLVAREGDPESIVATRQQLRLVQEVLDSLPARQRQAFILHRLEGLPISQIAAELGLSNTRSWELVHQAYRTIVLRLGGL